MHEYSIVSALVDQVAQAAEPRGARVQRVHVAIGELAGVDIELLRTAFDTFRARTVCEDAELEVRPVAAAWRCARCDAAIEAGAVLRCPGCGRPARLTAGDEIVLERIELEVPDV
ncbi:MAG TPA: hydrogenase maturation nickel metallochaperone HypA [Kofleriaceae bacterium]|nr:hydrogenase maturation nickel metallochaperone HypA [Kofleriaceae bacterium]